MAIARGAGTEIIRCQHFEDLAGGSDRNIIIGEQHHIYTVLSIIVYCNTQNASSDYVDMGILTPETFLRNQNTYLKRTYSKYKDDPSKFGEELRAAYYDKPKPAPKRRAKPKRKVSKKKKS